MDYQSKDMEIKLANQLVRKVRNDEIKENIGFGLSIVVLLVILFTVWNGNKLVDSMLSGQNVAVASIPSDIEGCGVVINEQTKGLEFIK